MLIVRTMCGLTHVTVAALCCSCSLLCISGTVTEQQRMKLDDQWVLTVMKSPLARTVTNTVQLWLQLFSLITHNKTPVHSKWGFLRVCAACLTPRLNLSSELRPSWNNIQDTFLTGSAPDTTQQLPHFVICR